MFRIGMRILEGKGPKITSIVESSAISKVDDWKSPVLIIQGDDANLSAIQQLRDITGLKVGWSDHTRRPAVIERLRPRDALGGGQGHPARRSVSRRPASGSDGAS